MQSRNLYEITEMEAIQRIYTQDKYDESLDFLPNNIDGLTGCEEMGALGIIYEDLETVSAIL